MARPDSGAAVIDKVIPQELQQMARYGLVGAICFLLNSVVLYVCIDLIGTGTILAVVACFVVVNAAGYILNKIFTFRRSRRPHSGGWVSYYGLMAVSLALSIGLFHVLVSELGLHYLVANILVTGLMFLFNYAGSRFIVFSGQA